MRFGRSKNWRANTKAEVFSTRDQARNWLAQALDKAPGYADGFFQEIVPGVPHAVLSEEIN